MGTLTYRVRQRGDFVGCDIHCYIEHRSLNPDSDYVKRWDGFGGRINPGRNYRVFERLAGVRGDECNAIAPPRGAPDDMAYEASADMWIWITYSGYVADGYASPETAAKYVQWSGSKYRGEVTLCKSRVTGEGGVVIETDNADHVGKPQWVSHPDWHSHSWVTPDEWERAISIDADWPVGVEYWAMLAAMRDLQKRGRDVRVVFWFDN